MSRVDLAALALAGGGEGTACSRRGLPPVSQLTPSPAHFSQMFYIINSPISPTSDLDETPPESAELDPSKPNIVFLHAGGSSSTEFSAQVSTSATEILDYLMFMPEKVQ